MPADIPPDILAKLQSAEEALAAASQKRAVTAQTAGAVVAAQAADLAAQADSRAADAAAAQASQDFIAAFKAHAGLPPTVIGAGRGFSRHQH
jgi:hypothetical protein